MDFQGLLTDAEDAPVDVDQIRPSFSILLFKLTVTELMVLVVVLVRSVKASA